MLRIRHKGAFQEVSSGGSLEELQKAVVEATGVDIATLKIIVGGRQLKSDNDAKGALASGATALVMGSTKAELMSVAEGDAVVDDLRHRAERRLHRKTVSIRHLSEKAEARREARQQFGFGAYRVLDGFSDADEAEELLRRLATDPGIRGVMEKRKYKVGTLSEMFPKGKVGVSPVCTLGVNVNRGQEISLRLRTDDLLGFRKFLSIKKVLYHELAHMEISEHTDEFFELCSLIEREANSLDWTRKKGRSVGGQARARSRLIDEYKDGTSMVETAQRYTQDDDACKQDNLIKDDVMVGAGCAGDNDGGACCSEEIRCVDAEPSDAVMEPQESTSPSFPSFEMELRDAIVKFVERNDLAVAIPALSLMVKILQNAAKPLDKYKQIRLKNAKFQASIGKYVGGCAVLVKSGFARTDASSEDDPILAYTLDAHHLKNAQQILGEFAGQLAAIAM